MLQQVFANPERSGWVYASRHFEGVARAVLLVASRVSLIGENNIKGVGNILGGIFHPSCSIGKGISQLTLGTFKNVVALTVTIPKALFTLVKDSPLVTLVIFYVIVRTHIARNTARREALDWLRNEQIEQQRLQKQQRAEYAQRLEKEKKAGEKALFMSLLQLDPKTPEGLFELAECYRLGKGIDQSIPTYSLYLEESAEKGCSRAAYRLGCLRANSNEYAEAKKYFAIATKAGNNEAAVCWAQLELEYPSPMEQKVQEISGPKPETDESSPASSSGATASTTIKQGYDHPDAFRLYTILANAGNIGAKVVLAYMYADGVKVKRDDEKAKSLFKEVAQRIINPQSRLFTSELIVMERSNQFLSHLWKEGNFTGVIRCNVWGRSVRASDETWACATHLATMLKLRDTVNDNENNGQLSEKSNETYIPEFVDFEYVKMYFTTWELRLQTT
jgi:TPR repeat protein